MQQFANPFCLLSHVYFLSYFSPQNKHAWAHVSDKEREAQRREGNDPLCGPRWAGGEPLGGTASGLGIRSAAASPHPPPGRVGLVSPWRVRPSPGCCRKAGPTPIAPGVPPHCPPCCLGLGVGCALGGVCLRTFRGGSMGLLVGLRATSLRTALYPSVLLSGQRETEERRWEEQELGERENEGRGERHMHKHACTQRHRSE